MGKDKELEIKEEIYELIKNEILDDVTESNRILSVLYYKPKLIQKVLTDLAEISGFLTDGRQLSKEISQCACEAIEKKFPNYVHRDLTENEFQYLQKLHYLASPGIFTEPGELQQIIVFLVENQIKKILNSSENSLLKQCFTLDNDEKLQILVASASVNYDILKSLGILS